MSKLGSLAVSDNGFIFNPLNGDTYTLNPTGNFIVQALKDNKDKEIVLSMLVDEYEVNYEDAERDYDNFISQLELHNLI